MDTTYQKLAPHRLSHTHTHRHTHTSTQEPILLKTHGAHVSGAHVTPITMIKSCLYRRMVGRQDGASRCGYHEYASRQRWQAPYTAHYEYSGSQPHPCSDVGGLELARGPTFNVCTCD